VDSIGIDEFAVRKGHVYKTIAVDHSKFLMNHFAVIASKKLAEVVCHTKYFGNFVLCNHSDLCL